MPNLGTAQTNKFSIGTAELRIGPLGSAGNLTQAHSVGLLDNATIEVSQNSVDLLGGFPQKIIDTAVISQESSLTATLREYSKRNINVMLGNTVEDYITAVATDSIVLDASDTAGVTLTLPTGEGTNWATGDYLVVHSALNPADVNVCRVASVAIDVITLDAGTPLDFTTAIGDFVFRAEESPIGDINNTNYFAATLIQTQRGNAARPAVFNFWKAAISGGMSYGTDSADFASTEFAIKLLEPSAADYGAGGTLVHLANIIPAHPSGMFVAGADK